MKTIHSGADALDQIQIVRDDFWIAWGNWIEAYRRREEARDCADDDPFDRTMEELANAERALCNAPVMSADQLAAKTFFASSLAAQRDDLYPPDAPQMQIFDRLIEDSDRLELLTFGVTDVVWPSSRGRGSQAMGA